MSPQAHLALLEEAWADARAAPLSSRKALLAAVLLDHLPDRLFAAGRADGAADIVAYRAALRRAHPALGMVFDLCAGRPGGAELVTEAVEVPIAEYGRLSVEDYMVSLYNRNTVQRVLLRAPDGSTRLAHDVLGEAVNWAREAGG